MPSPWRSFVRSFSTLALLALSLSGGAAPLAAQAVEESRADGLLIDGGLFRLDYAYAYLFREGEGESAKDYTMVVVADRPIDEREVRSEEALADRARAGDLRGFQVVIEDATGSVDRHVVLSATPRSTGGGDVHWLAEEFDQNTARGGASYRSSDGTWGYAAQFHALIRRAPRFLELGEAMGQLRLGQSTVELRRAVSWVEERGDSTFTHVVLSDRALSLADARDPARRSAIGRAGKAVGMEVTISDEDGAIETQSWFSKGSEQVSSTQGADWQSEQFTDALIRGRLVSSGPQEAMGSSWDYDVYFAAEIVSEAGAPDSNDVTEASDTRK
jgi:hypothetical protein